MKKNNRKKIFLVKIMTTNILNEWGIEKGTEFIIPVYTISEYHARQKIDTKYKCDSFYPDFDIISIIKENELYSSIL